MRPVEVRADLVVVADGRSSVVRDCSGLPVEDLGGLAPMCCGCGCPGTRATRSCSSTPIAARPLFLTDRGDYWQCGGVPAPKAAVAEMQAKGIEDFRATIVELAPFLKNRVAELRDWNDLKLLTVRVDRMRAVASPC